MKQKKIQDLLNKSFIKAKKKKRQCYLNGCEANAINSHILQRNGILTEISEGGHIVISETDFHNPELYHFKRIGLKSAFTFKGFCDEHDDELFKPIEEEEIDFDNYQSNLLFAYRTILSEKRKKEILNDWYNYQLHDGILKTVVDRELILATISQNQLSISDLEYYENICVDNLSNGKEDFVFKTRYVGKEEVCLASHFTYETTRERQEYIEKTGSDYERLTDIFVSFFPIGEESVFIMGYLKSMQEQCGKYVDNLFDLADPVLYHEISTLMLMRCEAWGCSESFYQKKIKRRESEINEIFRDAASTPDEDKSVDLNLFHDDNSKE